jgi:hypothetical protein
VHYKTQLQARMDEMLWPLSSGQQAEKFLKTIKEIV